MRFRTFLAAYGRGFAQMAFAQTPLAGLLILAAALAVAPWSALGAAAGGLVGTIAGRHSFRASGWAEWRLGLAGYNGAILGLLWGGVLVREPLAPAWFALALAACILLEPPLRRAFARLDLPPLSLAAMLVGWGSDFAFRIAGMDFWPQPDLLPLGPPGVVVAALLVTAAMLSMSWIGCAQAVVLSLFIALLSGLAAGEALGPAGLWAFAVAPAAFALPAVFAAGTAAGGWAGVGAAAVAAGAWWLWYAGPLGTLVPPLLLPCFAGIWLALAAARRIGGGAADPALEAAARALLAARDAGRPAAVLSGAGLSTASGIPDYISGSWLDPEVPVDNYGYGRFLASRTCRAQYWQACSRFRALALAGGPNPAHRALVRLEDSGFVRGIVTQNVDGYHQAAGSQRVVELHGNIRETRCIACSRRHPWPTGAAWRDCDPLCAACGGLLKPAVVALGENLLPGIWDSALAAVERCGVLVVVGTQVAVSTAFHLVAEARRHGARVVFINLGPVAAPVLPSDVVIAAPAEDALPALCARLGCAPAAEKARLRPKAA